MIAGKLGEPLPKMVARIFSRKRFDTPELAREIVSYLLSQPQFAPNRFGSYGQYKHLIPESKEQAVELVANLAGQELDPNRIFTMVDFEQTRYPRCSYTVMWSRLPHKKFELSSYEIADNFVYKPEGLNDWLSFVLGLVDIHNSWYASFTHHEEALYKNFINWWSQHPRAKDPVKGVESVRGIGLNLEESIPGVYWGNYFGPFYVEWFGREKFDEIPCIEKRWLDTGGIFFTTAETPFEWDNSAARELQEAVKQHLGADAFLDMETVRALVRELEPIPESMKPEQFQSPRRVPTFPFEVQEPPRKSVEEELQEAREYFESQGFKFVELVDSKTLVFSDEKEGLTRVTVGPGGNVEYRPQSD